LFPKKGFGGVAILVGSIASSGKVSFNARFKEPEYPDNKPPPYFRCCYKREKGKREIKKNPVGCILSAAIGPAVGVIRVESYGIGKLQQFLLSVVDICPITLRFLRRSSQGAP